MNFAYLGYFGDISAFSQCVRAKSSWVVACVTQTCLFRESPSVSHHRETPPSCSQRPARVDTRGRRFSGCEECRVEVRERRARVRTRLRGKKRPAVRSLQPWKGGASLARRSKKTTGRVTAAMAADEGDWECPHWCVSSSSRDVSPFRRPYSSRDTVARATRGGSVHATSSWVAFSPFAFLKVSS